MTEDQRAKIRVSDTEREDALGKLGEHMSSGRLDIDEYGERTAKVAAAKTRGDVLALFDDLPDPRPTFGQPAPPAVRTPDAVAPGRTRTLAERVGPVVVPIVGVLAVVGLVFLLKAPFLLFVAFFFLASGGGRWRGHGGPRGPHRRGPYRHDYRRDWRRSAD